MDLDVGVAQRLQRPGDLGAGRGREDLVADDRGAAPLAHLVGEPVPGAVGLGLQPAPRQLHQVQRGQEVGVEPVAGVEDAGPAEGALVAEQDVLEVRRAGLRGADVQQDPRAHRASLLVGVSRPVDARQDQPHRQSQRRGPVGRPDTAPAPGQEGVRVAVHSVASAAESVGDALGLGVGPGEVLLREHQGLARPSSASSGRRRRRSSAVRSSAGTCSPRTVATRRARSGTSAAGAAAARQAAYADQARQLVRVQHDVHPRAAGPRGPRARLGEQVDAAREPVVPGDLVEPGAPAGGTEVEGTPGPGVGEHPVDGRAEDEHRGQPPAGRAAAGDERVADGVGELGVADEAVAGAPGPQPRRDAAGAGRRPRPGPRR